MTPPLPLSFSNSTVSKQHICTNDSRPHSIRRGGGMRSADPVHLRDVR